MLKKCFVYKILKKVYSKQKKSVYVNKEQNHYYILM